MITGLFKKNPPFDLEEEKDVYFIRGYFYRAENDKEKELVNMCVSIEDCVVQAEDESDPVALFFEAIKELCFKLDVAKKYSLGFVVRLTEEVKDSI